MNFNRNYPVNGGWSRVILASVIALMVFVTPGLAVDLISNGDFEADPFDTDWTAYTAFLHRGLAATGLDEPGTQAAYLNSASNLTMKQNALLQYSQWQLDFLLAAEDPFYSGERSLQMTIENGDYSYINMKLDPSGYLFCYDQSLGWQQINTTMPISFSVDSDANKSFADPGDTLNVHSLRIVGDYFTASPSYDVYVSNANSSTLTLVASGLEYYQFSHPTTGVGVNSIAFSTISSTASYAIDQVSLIPLGTANELVNGDFEADPFGDGWNSSASAMSEHQGLVAGGLDEVGSKSALMHDSTSFQSSLAIGPQWQLDLLFASDTVTADRSLNFALRYTGGAINFRLGASGNLEAYDQDLGWSTISSETVSFSQDVDINGSYADAGDILNVYSLRLVGDFSAETPYYDVYLSDANSSELALIASNVELWQFDDPTSESLIYDMTLVGTGSNYLIDEIVLENISTSEPVPGDANKDGKVDGSDVTILAGNWQAGVNPGDDAATWDMGDFNGDGKVDGSDVTILAGNWQCGVEAAAAAAVPEPSTLLLLIGMFAGLTLARRR